MAEFHRTLSISLDKLHVEEQFELVYPNIELKIDYINV